MTIGDREYPLAAITKIIEARVSEIFDIIKDQLVDADLYVPADIASGVVMTGGTSRLVGIDEVARRSLGLDARQSEGPRDVSPELRVPEYSSALGLLHYALKGQEDEQQHAKPVGIFPRLRDILNF
jgi:cell division protein FtsA